VSRRTERIGSLLRAVLAEAIRNRLNDPRIEPLTSITRVEVSADLSVAHVYVSVMAEGARRELSVETLRHAAGRLRCMVAERVALRQTPELDFRLDESVRRSFETVQRLDRMMAELDEPAGPSAEQEEVALDEAEPTSQVVDFERATVSELGAEEKTRPGGRAGEVPEE
jgi:ribosome-binding factor A